MDNALNNLSAIGEYKMGNDEVKKLYEDSIVDIHADTDYALYTNLWEFVIPLQTSMEVGYYHEFTWICDLQPGVRINGYKKKINEHNKPVLLLNIHVISLSDVRTTIIPKGTPIIRMYVKWSLSEWLFKTFANIPKVSFKDNDNTVDDISKDLPIIGEYKLRDDDIKVLYEDSIVDIHADTDFALHGDLRELAIPLQTGIKSGYDHEFKWICDSRMFVEIGGYKKKINQHNKPIFLIDMTVYCFYDYSSIKILKGTPIMRLHVKRTSSAWRFNTPVYNRAFLRIR